MLRFPGDTDGVDRVELQYRRLMSSLVTLNAVFEAARVGSAGKLLSASVGEIEDMLEAAVSSPGEE